MQTAMARTSNTNFVGDSTDGIYIVAMRGREISDEDIAIVGSNIKSGKVWLLDQKVTGVFQ